MVLAWVSFWVDREQTAARIAMGITTVLTMATLIGSARTSLPKVSYVKSLEWFLIMCFLFVFSAILEYAFVSYLVFKNRVEERERAAMRKKNDDVSNYIGFVTLFLSPHFTAFSLNVRTFFLAKMLFLALSNNSFFVKKKCTRLVIFSAFNS